MILRDIQDVYQKYSNLDKNLYEKNLLKKFYNDLLDKTLSVHDSEMVVWGFINMNSKNAILTNINKINSLINRINPYTRIGLQTNLSFKIKELEKIVIPDIINMLNSQNDCQLDERFFMSIIDNLTRGINRLNPEYKYDNNKLSITQNNSVFSFGACTINRLHKNSVKQGP